MSSVINLIKLGGQAMKMTISALLASPVYILVWITKVLLSFLDALGILDFVLSFWGRSIWPACKRLNLLITPGNQSFQQAATANATAVTIAMFLLVNTKQPWPILQESSNSQTLGEFVVRTTPLFVQPLGLIFLNCSIWLYYRTPVIKDEEGNQIGGGDIDPKVSLPNMVGWIASVVLFLLYLLICVRYVT